MQPSPRDAVEAPVHLADYLVIRPAPDLPAGFLPDRWEGLWLDRRDVSPDGRAIKRVIVGGVVAVATGRSEFRGDGARAEVFEVRP